MVTVSAIAERSGADSHPADSKLVSLTKGSYRKQDVEGLVEKRFTWY